MPTGTPPPTPTLTATLTATPLPTSTPTLTPTPVGGGSGKVVFEYRQAGYEKDFPSLGGESQIFIANWDGTDLTPITKGLMTYNTLADVSPDGHKVLVITWPEQYTALDTTSAVYVIDLEHLEREPLKLASGIMYTPHRTAVWLDNSRVVLVDKEQGSWSVFLMNGDGTGRRKLSKYVAGVHPMDLRVSADANWVLWHGFGWAGGYTEGGIWRVRADGSELSRLGGSTDMTTDGISPDGSQMVWKVTERGNHFENIYVSSIADLNHPIVFEREPGHASFVYAQILWSPDATKVLLNRATCKSNGAVRLWHSLTKILSPQELQLWEIFFPPSYNNLSVNFLDWSPDSQNLLVRVSPMGSCYMDNVQALGTLEIMNLDTMAFSVTLTNGVSQDSVGNVYWIP